MAEDDPKKAQGEAAPGAAPGGGPQEGAADLPIMPDDMAGQTGDKRRVTLPWWVLLVFLVIFIAACFGFYRLGHSRGVRSVYQADLGSMHLKTEFTDAIYPILDLKANLADEKHPKFVHLSMHLSLNDNEGLRECAARESELRDVLLTLFARKTSFEIDSVTEQRRLKRLLKDELNDNLAQARVNDIYFSRFIIGYRVQLEFDENTLLTSPRLGMTVPEP